MGSFLLFDSGTYFGRGPDSDLMMAPDDGYSIMTHPEGEKKKRLSGYFLQLQPHCIYLVSCRDTLIKLPDNFW